MNLIIEQSCKDVSSRIIIVYLASDFSLDAVDSAAVLEDDYANVKFIASALKEPFHHLTCTLIQGLLHELNIISGKLLDFLQRSFLNVVSDSGNVPFIASLDPVKSHALKYFNLL